MERLHVHPAARKAHCQCCVLPLGSAWRHTRRRNTDGQGSPTGPNSGVHRRSRLECHPSWQDHTAVPRRVCGTGIDDAGIQRMSCLVYPDDWHLPQLKCQQIVTGVRAITAGRVAEVLGHVAIGGVYFRVWKCTVEHGAISQAAPIESPADVVEEPHEGARLCGHSAAAHNPGDGALCHLHGRYPAWLH